MKYCYIAGRALNFGTKQYKEGQAIDISEVELGLLARMEVTGYLRKCVVAGPEEISRLEAEGKLLDIMDKGVPIRSTEVKKTEVKKK